MAAARLREPSVLPGFGLTLGFTACSCALIVLIPLAALVMKARELAAGAILARSLTEPRALAVVPAHVRRVARRGDHQHRVRLHRRLDAGALPLPGPRIIDALIDMPFALPTAVSGIALTTVFAAERLDRRMPRSRSASRWRTPGSA